MSGACSCRLLRDLDALASEWMRSQDRGAEYQDGMADAAEQLRLRIYKDDGSLAFPDCCKR